MKPKPPIQITVTGAPRGLQRGIERVIVESLQRWARSNPQGKAAASIDVTIVTDRAIAVINRRWLNHRGSTDVITFPLSKPGNWPVEGQIIVSLDTARREARRRGITVQEELTRYVAHGLLHLLGFDDDSREDSLRMDMIETMLLDLINIRYTHTGTGLR